MLLNYNVGSAYPYLPTYYIVIVMIWYAIAHLRSEISHRRRNRHGMYYEFRIFRNYAHVACALLLYFIDTRR